MTEQIINPQTPVTGNAVVSGGNPLPVTVVLVAPPADTGAVINPVTWVLGNAIVSTANPLPLQIY